jgi:hypothetical protein
MSCDVDGIERTIGLALKGLDITIQIDYKIVPRGLFIPTAWRLHKERLDFCFICCGREDDSSLSLHETICYLSEIANDKFNIPREPGIEINLEDEILLYQI